MTIFDLPGDPCEVLELGMVLLILVGHGDEFWQGHEVVRDPLLEPLVLGHRDVLLDDGGPRPGADLRLELDVGQLLGGPAPPDAVHQAPGLVQGQVLSLQAQFYSVDFSQSVVSTSKNCQQKLPAKIASKI